MFNHRMTRIALLAGLTAASLATAGKASAAGFFDDLEGSAPVGFTRTSGVTGTGSSRFTNAGEPTLGNRGYRFQLEDVDTGYARISYTATAANGPIGRLRDVTASFDTYIDSTSFNLTPYILLGVDSNQNGVYDSATDALVIQFTSKISGAPATNTWLSEGLDAANGVHVQVDRGMLPGTGAGNYQPDETPDLLGNLYDINYNSTTKWGDLNVLFARVAAGNFAGGDGNQPYLGYVDNIKVQAVPEPATMAILGLGAAALLRRRRAR